MGIQSNIGGLPGISAVTYSDEGNVTFGRFEWERFDPLGILLSSTVDNNTPTTTLKPGLLLGRVTASGKYTHYLPTATNGSQTIAGVLTSGVVMLNAVSGSAEDKMAGGAGSPILVQGAVKVASLHRQDGTALTLYDKQQLVKAGFVLDEPIPQLEMGDQLTRRVTKTADYTIVAADNGTDFDNTGDAGAIEFTLPAIADGYVFHFHNMVDQNMTITSAEGDNIVVLNNAAADGVAFSTSSEKIGGQLRVYSRGAKWHVENRSPLNTLTVVSA